MPITDPWLLLAAVALRTSRVRLGPMVTPLPRRRPWKLAREAVTLDHLSRGRIILGVGIGRGAEYRCFGETDDARAHGAMLDEGLAVLEGLWSGEPFSFSGAHYQVEGAYFLPRPVQAHIPIWVAGIWPNKPPFRRAARWDGLFPLGRGLSFTEQMTPAAIGEAAAYTRSHRATERAAAPLDLAHWGISGDDDPGADRALVEGYAAAGVTWWVENFNNERGTLEAQRARIRKGPPRLA